MTDSLYFLDNDDVLIVHRTLARAIGLNRSIVLRQIRYWLELNRKAKKDDHYRDDSWWTYNTYEDWQIDNFNFWSEDTVYRAIESLRNEFGLIYATDQYNQKNYDRTLWYTVHYGNYAAFMRLWHDCNQPMCGMGKWSDDYALFFELWEQQREEMKYGVSEKTLTAMCGEPSPQCAEMEDRNVRRPIPEINTETNSNTGERFLQKPSRGSAMRIPKGAVMGVPVSTGNESKAHRDLELFILKALKKTSLTETQRKVLWESVRVISREGEESYRSPVDLYDDDQNYKTFAEEKVLQNVNASNGKVGLSQIVKVLSDYGHQHGWLAYQKQHQVVQERSQVFEKKAPVIAGGKKSNDQ